MTAKLENAPEASPNARGTAELRAAYRAMRRQTEDLCEPLEIEDYVIQSMPEASPANSASNVSPSGRSAP